MSVEGLLDQRIVRIDGEIDDNLSLKVVAQLLYLHHQAPGQLIIIQLDSPGGLITSGMAVVDTVLSIGSPIRVEARHRAQGTALFILASGSQGERVLAPDAVVTMTPILFDDELFQEKEHADTHEIISLMLSQLTGRPQEWIEENLRVGRSFSPLEAICFGFADKVE